MVVLLSSMPDPCHGQSWWSWASSPPSPSASTNSSTATPPSPLYTSPAPPPSPSAPTTPATPPSPTFSVPSTPAAPPSPTFGVPTTPSTLPSSAPTTSSTTSTTLIVMTTSFFFGPETIYTSVQDAIDAVPGKSSSRFLCCCWGKYRIFDRDLSFFSFFFLLFNEVSADHLLLHHLSQKTTLTCIPLRFSLARTREFV